MSKTYLLFFCKITWHPLAQSYGAVGASCAVTKCKRRESRWLSPDGSGTAFRLLDKNKERLLILLCRSFVLGLPYGNIATIL